MEMRNYVIHLQRLLVDMILRNIFQTIDVYKRQVYRIVVGEIDWHTVFSTFYWGGPFLRFSWYVTEIVLLYLFFYVIMRSSVSKQHKIYILTFLILLMMGVLIATKQPIWSVSYTHLK